MREKSFTMLFRRRRYSGNHTIKAKRHRDLAAQNPPVRRHTERQEFVLLEELLAQEPTLARRFWT